jgi:hypothetical protein
MEPVAWQCCWSIGFSQRIRNYRVKTGGRASLLAHFSILPKAFQQQGRNSDLTPAGCRLMRPGRSRSPCLPCNCTHPLKFHHAAGITRLQCHTAASPNVHLLIGGTHHGGAVGNVEGFLEFHQIGQWTVDAEARWRMRIRVHLQFQIFIPLH